MGMARGRPSSRSAPSRRCWEYRNLPAVSAQARARPEPHDACFVPRRSHVTGDIRIHDMAFAGDELWVGQHPLLLPGDARRRAQLRAPLAAAVRHRAGRRGPLPPQRPGHGRRPAALRHRARRRPTPPSGWRAGKADGRRADRRRQLGEVGRPRPLDAALAALARRPALAARVGQGHARRRRPRHRHASRRSPSSPASPAGWPSPARYAFVGLSQVREATTFGGMPLDRAARGAPCGVWVVDIAAGEIVGFLRFEGLVQEIFDVAVLPGIRFPEIAEHGSDAVNLSYVVPDGGSPATPAGPPRADQPFLTFTTSQLALTLSLASTLALSLPPPQLSLSFLPSAVLILSLPPEALTLSLPLPGLILSLPPPPETLSLPPPPLSLSLPPPPLTLSLPPAPLSLSLPAPPVIRSCPRRRWRCRCRHRPRGSRWRPGPGGCRRRRHRSAASTLTLPVIVSARLGARVWALGSGDRLSHRCPFAGSPFSPGCSSVGPMSVPSEPLMFGTGESKVRAARPRWSVLRPLAIPASITGELRPAGWSGSGRRCRAAGRAGGRRRRCC